MVNSVIPAITNKMSFTDSVVIQIDNAPPHTGKNNVQRLNDFEKDEEPSISIICQPAQSPDLNVNDLGFYHSLCSVVEKSDKQDLNQLWQIIKDAFNNYDVDKLTRIWDIKSACIQEVIKARGQSITIPHSGVRSS